MNFKPQNKTSNIILLIAAFVIVSLILWNTNSFFKKFKEEEKFRKKLEESDREFREKFRPLILWN